MPKMIHPKTPPPTVVDLDRDKLVFCDNKSAVTLAFPYPAGTLRDMEIASRDELDSKLKSFIAEKKLTPTNLVFVLSPSVYFEKDLSRLSQEERDSQAHKFLDMVPFSSVSSKLFHLGSDYQLVAINREFYEVIRQAFESMGFKVLAVVPSFVLGSIGVKDNFDIDACRVILKRIDFVLANSFLTPEPPSEGLGKHRQYIKTHPAAFALLSLLPLVILSLTAYITLRRPTPAVTAAPASTTRPTLPTDTPTPTPEGTPSAQLTVQILNGSGQIGLAGDIQSALAELGFAAANITVGNAPSTSGQTLVAYSARVPHPLRDQVGDTLTRFFPAFSAQEVASPSSDIIITTGPILP